MDTNITQIGNENKNPLSIVSCRSRERMATIIGHVEAFDEAREQWTKYVECFELFVDANDISEEEECQYFSA